jgi:hypothetical protein
MSVQSGHDIARTVKYQCWIRPKVLDVMVHLERIKPHQKRIVRKEYSSNNKFYEELNDFLR